MSLRVLFDVVHPAHVHFFRCMIAELEGAGHETRVVARAKDVTTELLDAFGIPFVSVGASGPKGLVGQGVELVQRDIALARIGRRYRPHVVCTRNPSGVQAARLIGPRTRGIFDTDDGRSVGLHFWAAAPFAHVITTPACTTERYGRRHRRYRGYKALAYLHPNRFTPDPSVRELLGVGDSEPYSIVRFVANWAVHDRRVSGLPHDARVEAVATLARAGRVFISSETTLPAELEPYRLHAPPHRMLDALAFAQVCVGDSQSVAMEAALLGTPALRCTEWTAKHESLRELESRFGLVANFVPSQAGEFLDAVRAWASDAGLRPAWAAKRDAMLAEMDDVTGWYVRLIEETARR